MSKRLIQVPEDLQQLKPSSDLETVSVSRLARKGTELLSQLTESSQAVAVQVQGLGSMVTLSRRQYDEMIELVRLLSDESVDDDFTRTLSEHFDSMIATMNQPGASDAVDAALFADADTLNASYRPGTTETDTGSKD